MLLTRKNELGANIKTKILEIGINEDGILQLKPNWKNLHKMDPILWIRLWREVLPSVMLEMNNRKVKKFNKVKKA